MARKDYEDIAAATLGTADVETAVHGDERFLPLGTFNGGDNERVIRAVTERRMGLLMSLGDHLLAQYERSDEVSLRKEQLAITRSDEWRSFVQKIFHPYDEYLYALKNIKSIIGLGDKIKKMSYEIKKMDEGVGKLTNASYKARRERQSEYVKDIAKLRQENLKWGQLKSLYEKLPTKITPNIEGYLCYLGAAEPDMLKLIKTLYVPALISEDDRMRHSYITGGSGSGKSELLKQIVFGYTRHHPAYCATVVIDPHGDLVEDIAKWSDFAGHDRLIYLDMDLVKGYGPTLNPLQLPEGVSSDVMAQQLLGAFEQMLAGDGGNSLTNNMRALLQPCLKVLLERKGSTLLDLKRFMKSDGRADDLIALGAKSKNIVTAEFFQYDFTEKKFESTKGSIATKIDSVLASEATQAMFLGETSFDLLKAIENRQTVLVKLSKGIVGSEAAQAFGRFLISYLQAIAIRRASEDAENRIPVHLIVDECHNFISESMEELLAESRKYKLYLTLAQQISGYKMNSNLKRVVLGNTRIKMAGYNDDEGTVKAMSNALEVDASDLSSLNVGEFFVRMGKGAAKLMKASSSLVDVDGQGPNDMTDDEWKVLTAWQATHYYRKLDEEAKTYEAPKGTKTKVKAIKKYELDLV